MTAPRVRAVPNRDGEFRVIWDNRIIGRVQRSGGGRRWRVALPRTDEWLPQRFRTRTEAVGALILIAEQVAA